MRIDPIRAASIVVLVAFVSFCCGVVYGRAHPAPWQVMHTSSSSSGEECCGGPGVPP